MSVDASNSQLSVDKSNSQMSVDTSNSQMSVDAYNSVDASESLAQSSKSKDIVGESPSKGTDTGDDAALVSKASKLRQAKEILESIPSREESGVCVMNDDTHAETWAEADALLSQCIGGFPEEELGEILSLRAECRLAIGETDDAQVDARRAVDILPTSWRAHMVIGQVLYTLFGERDVAAPHFDQAKSLLERSGEQDTVTGLERSLDAWIEEKDEEISSFYCMISSSHRQAKEVLESIPSRDEKGACVMRDNIHAGSWALAGKLLSFSFPNGMGFTTGYKIMGEICSMQAECELAVGKIEAAHQHAELAVKISPLLWRPNVILGQCLLTQSVPCDDREMYDFTTGETYKRGLQQFGDARRKLERSGAQKDTIDHLRRSLERWVEDNLFRPDVSKSQVPTDTSKSQVPTDTSKSQVPTDTSKSQVPTDTSKSQVPADTSKSQVKSIDIESLRIEDVQQDPKQDRRNGLVQCRKACGDGLVAIVLALVFIIGYGLYQSAKGIFYCVCAIPYLVNGRRSRSQ